MENIKVLQVKVSRYLNTKNKFQRYCLSDWQKKVVNQFLVTLCHWVTIYKYTHEVTL